MRDQFTFDSLLPADLADALELIQQPLPTDPLSATGTLLTGYSGLFKIGTRVAQDHQYSVPCNAFWANVDYSGQGKSPIHQRLISDPAKGTVGVRALQSIDIAVRHAESFAAMQDAIA